jgi:copper oxidase (laccase) domain-containing protein
VLDALSARFGSLDEGVAQPTRTGHARIDLGALVARELASCGFRAQDVGRLPETCTRCEPDRFHSYRRDGARAGRLWHFVAAVRQAPRVAGAQA